MKSPAPFYALVRLPDGTNISVGRDGFGGWIVTAGRERFPVERALTSGAEWAERELAPPLHTIAYQTFEFFKSACETAAKAGGA
jgi:hypothetical protein